MKVFFIELSETVVNRAEVEIMAEDEPTARQMAFSRADIDWREDRRYTAIDRIQVVTDSNV